jgi:lipopolysaccharide export system protein LptA
MQLRVRLDRLLFWAIAMLLSVQLVPVIGLAAEPEKAAPPNQQEQEIEIVADRLISDNQEKYAEFQGNVVATQGDFKVTSDKLRIYYEGDMMKSGNQSSTEQSVKKIVATGNVKINTEQYQAESDMAEYEMATQIIVLTGDNSTVVSGKNSLKGAKITMWRNEGRVKVDSSPQSRVKAVLYSKGEGANPLDTKGTEKGRKKKQ